MNKPSVSLLLLLIVVITSTGCLTSTRPAPRIDFYTLEYTAPCRKASSPLPVVLNIPRFSIVPDYSTQRIVFQDTPFQRNEYVYHRWHADPADLVTAFMTRDFQASGRFLAVNHAGAGLSATHTLTGSVTSFYEHDLPRGWEAVLGLTITLTRTDEPDITRRILFQKNYTTARPCETRTPSAVARAMSEAMQELSQRILTDVTAAMQHQMR